MSGLLATKVKASGGPSCRNGARLALAGVVIAPGAGVACLWSVPGLFPGRGVSAAVS